MEKVRLNASRQVWRIDGMHCPRCEVAVRRALRGLDGLEEIEVSYAQGTLSAIWDKNRLSEAELDARLKSAGYGLKRGVETAGRSFVRMLGLLAASGILYWLLTRTAVAQWAQAFPTVRDGMGYGMLFVVGLATSLHCVAMCGGINMAQSASSAQKGVFPGRANICYNLGRLTSYTVIGGLIGAAGTMFSLSSSTKAAIQLVAAAFMLLMAANLLGGFSWLRRLMPRLPGRLSMGLSRWTAGKSSYVIGLANGLMPCGPMQAMQLYALSTGNWQRGALSMACFCLGTIPLMFGIGLIGGKLNRRFAKSMQVVSAALVLAMGISALTNGLALAGVSIAPVSEEGGSVASLQDGMQIVRSELEFGGYPTITVQAGIPVTWTIHAEANRINGCNHEIYIPKFDLSVPLEPGDNVICFTPEESGTIPYTCWMGMLRGAIEVTEDTP